MDQVKAPRKWVIYTLSDPQSGEIRYCGFTSARRPETRLSEHVCHSKRRRTRVQCWVFSLLTKGLRPAMNIVQNGQGDGWASAEQHWITTLKAQGVRLLNHTEGGEGTIGWNPSPEFRARAAARQGRINLARGPVSNEVRAKLRQSQGKRFDALRAQGADLMPYWMHTPEAHEKSAKARRGQKRTDEQRRAMSEAHKNPPAEFREKWRQAIYRRPREQREAFAKINTGRKFTDEHRLKMSEAAKRRWARVRKEVDT
jgi:hypothetical protein